MTKVEPSVVFDDDFAVVLTYYFLRILQKVAKLERGGGESRKQSVYARLKILPFDDPHL